MRVYVCIYMYIYIYIYIYTHTKVPSRALSERAHRELGPLSLTKIPPVEPRKSDFCL